MGVFAFLLTACSVLGQGFPTKESAVGRLFSEVENFQEGPDAAPRARELRERAVAWEPESDNPQEITFWGMAVLGSFGKSLRFEWMDTESRRTGFHQWVETLRKKTFLASPDSLGFQFCTTFWIYFDKKDAKAALDFFEWAEKRFVEPLKEPDNHRGWAMDKSNFAENYLLFHPSEGPPAEKELRTAAQSIIGRVLADERLPLAQRTEVLRRRAETLYSATDMSGAARLYEDWWHRHPDAKLDENLCFSRYCLAQFGLGDVETARRMLAALDELTQGQATGGSAQTLKIMTETYYEDLRLSTPERWRKAASFAESSRRLYLQRIAP